ncbi:hypothetical protein ACHAWU_005510 [Discostella pseudostelligera]|uniref:Fatty acid hydroxylase domain-containing protein n=1 Tax=Discostella pseudostelligera TaxID=259834 RepID=A0ABD3N0D7_9STRA
MTSETTTTELRRRRQHNDNDGDRFETPMTMTSKSAADDDDVDACSSSCSDSDAPLNEASSASTKNKSSSLPESSQSILQSVLPWFGLLVWPCMLFLPLLLNHTINFHYTNLFPREWYTTRGENWLDKSIELGGIWEWGTNHWLQFIGEHSKPLRHPLGLSLGISAVAVGHVFLLLYFRLHQQQILGKTTPVQRRGTVQYIYSEALQNHLSQPGGFLLLGLYLTITWVFDMLPPSYYSFAGGIQYSRVALCLICQDFVQFVMHKLEHVAHPKMYRISHKPHHKFTNPKLFDAFDGSVPDTAIMILVPLFVTAHIVRDCNVWTYMAFGSSYANWLTLIHSEVIFPWEPRLFRSLGLGTSADHHVHHKFFKYNFGHLFMWFDMMVGTYRSPSEVWGQEFNFGV